MSSAPGDPFMNLDPTSPTKEQLKARIDLIESDNKKLITTGNKLRTMDKWHRSKHDRNKSTIERLKDAYVNVSNQSVKEKQASAATLKLADDEKKQLAQEAFQSKIEVSNSNVLISEQNDQIKELERRNKSLWTELKQAKVASATLLAAATASAEEMLDDAHDLMQCW